MSSTSLKSSNRRAGAPPELHNGDRMTREEFHRVYEQMPEDFRAELVEGIVYVASPLKRRQGRAHPLLSAAFVQYERHTPGVEMGDNATVLLGDESESQPDLYLRILPEYGGQSRTSAEDYVEGAPELIAEVAHSSRSIDLHAKRRDYARYGVPEYLVVNLADRKLHWFDLRAGKEISRDADGVIRVRAFPGLWIDPSGLLVHDIERTMKTLDAGLATPEHAEFVRALAARRA